MADLLAHGPDQARRRPRWLIPASFVMVAAVVLLVARPDLWPPGDNALPQPSGSLSPRAVATSPARSGPATVPSSDLPAWPAAPGACGSEAQLPLTSPGPMHATTGLTILVGGAGLRVVDIDTGAVRQVGRGQVTELAASTAGVFALRVRCDQLIGPAGTVLALDPARRTLTTALGGRADSFLSGPDTVWAFSYPADVATRPMVLRPVDGGRPVTLPVGFEAAAANSRFFLGSVIRDGEQPTDGGFGIATVSRARPAVVRHLGRGYPAAATDGFALTYRSCDQAASCELTSIPTRLGAATRHFPLPPARAIASTVVVSVDGRYAAFQLSRPDPDPRYAPGHPGGPSDLAVQDLRTGTLSLIPGVELAPKAAAGLGFSRDSRWLIIALNEGRRARLLVWRPGLTQAMESPARLPGGVLYSVPVLDVTDRAGLSPR